MTAESATVACPHCGNDQGIYARADIRWQPTTQSWEIADIEADLDCMACDHAWPLPRDWPRPLN